MMAAAGALLPRAFGSRRAARARTVCAASRPAADGFAAAAAKLPALARKALVELNTDVDASALIRSLPLRKDDKAEALAALVAPTTEGLLLHKPAALSLEACANLRKLVSSRVNGAALDTVDGLPEYQVNFTRQELERVIGAQAVASLWALPRTLDVAAPARFTQVRIFARSYGPTTRPLLALHTDASDWTVNVALSDDSDVAGGRLLLLHGSRVQVQERRAGDATVHKWSLVHGVTPVAAGTRFSLILFFFHRRQPE